jgi:hypothetical protein
MNTYVEKLKLIEWITKIQDSKVIEKLISIHKEYETDWWDEISESERQEIEAGLKDFKEGRTVDHAEVRKLYEEYL